MSGNILFADNDCDFLETRAEFLERAGYTVIKAPNLSEAVWLLKNARVHAAIIDVRMQDDDDPLDQSGLSLLEESTCRSIPVIILTGYPSVDIAVRVLRADTDGRSLAVDFVNKEDGPNAVIEALSRAFANPRFRINFSLPIDWHSTSPSDLVRHIEPDAANERERLRNREEELEDLFRRLLYEKDRIRIERVLWKRAGRVALTVFAFKEGAAMDQFVVVCGQNALVVDEANRFAKFAPKTQSETSTTLGEKDKAETTHFAANAYSLGQADLETIHTLYEVYRGGDRNLFKVAMQNLFDKVLPAWYQKQMIPTDRALEDLYRERLGLTAERISPQAIRARWDALVRYLPEFKTLVPNPDAISALLQTNVLEQPALKIESPGMLVGEGILVDADGHVWLTDFADAGEAPQLWDFVALESTIRFDWVEEKRLERLKEIEKNLLDDGHFKEPSIDGVESALAQRAVKFIQCIRQHAARAAGKEYLPYHLGIFFHAARRVVDFDLAWIDKPMEQARLAHALLGMAMIAERVGQPRHQQVVSVVERGLRVDNDGVKRDGKRLSVRGQSLELLRYLADPPNQLRTRREIIQKFLKQPFNEQNKTQTSWLYTAVRRLREKIEYDPDNPRFLLNESDGYRLQLQPPDE